MAEVEVVYKVEDGSGGTEFGDANILSDEVTHYGWDASLANMECGHTGKTAFPPGHIFSRYRISDNAIPPGATVLHVKIRIVFAANAVVPRGTAQAKLGMLVDDGVFTHASSVGWEYGASAWQYGNSYELPFPTWYPSDTVNVGVLEDDDFLGKFTYDSTWSSATGLLYIGDEDASPDQGFDSGSGNPIGDSWDAKRGAGEDVIAMVFSPFDVIDPLQNENFSIASRDFNDETGMRVHLTYEEGVPSITSDIGPPTVYEGSLYTHTVTATDPVSLVVPSPATPAYSLSAAPHGMTIDATTGVISWGAYPVAGSSHTVTVVATDTDGFTDSQSWVVTIIRRGAKGVDATSIANAALVMLGARRIGDIEGSSDSAKIVREVYDEVLEGLLREHPWSFATARVELDCLGGDPVYGYSHSLILPFDCLRVTEVDDEMDLGWAVEGRTLLSNGPLPTRLTYVQRVTDTSEMPPDFRQLLSLRIAIEISHSIAGDIDVGDLYARDERQTELAKGAESQQDSPRERALGEWQAFRGRHED